MARGRKQDLTPGASPLHFFGSEVRRAREAADMTLSNLAAMIPCAPSTVSRVESGTLAPDGHFAQVCDEAFPQVGGWFTRFYTDSRDWNTPFPAAFRPFTFYEAEASALYLFEHALLPGLFQTEAYARGVLAQHPDTTEAQVSERVAARIVRQAVLDREAPPHVWAVISESALHREVGSVKTMHEALTHVAELARRPGITVQVLTKSVHVGLQGAFAIAEATGATSTAYLEDASDGRVTQDSATVNGLAVRFRSLQTEAMTATTSRDLLERLAKERWDT
jgi:transcriptional regulator with XRE-family HTH domain